MTVVICCPLSGTTRFMLYQKGKTNPDFTEASGSEWQWHQLGHMQVCTSLQTDNHASTPPLSFLQAGCPSCLPTNSVKALKAKQSTKKEKTASVQANKSACAYDTVFPLVSLSSHCIVQASVCGERRECSGTAEERVSRRAALPISPRCRSLSADSR